MESTTLAYSEFKNDRTIISASLLYIFYVPLDNRLTHDMDTPSQNLRKGNFTNSIGGRNWQRQLALSSFISLFQL